MQWPLRSRQCPPSKNGATPTAPTHVSLKKVLVIEPQDQDSNKQRKETSWAARQARKDELSNAARSVSARAATFLRESSPAPSDRSACSSGGSSSVASSVAKSHGLPKKNTCASSLIQMWRELEAEAGPVRTPGASSGATSSITTVSDESEGSVDSEHEGIGSSSSANDNEKGQVGSIVRALKFKSTTQRSVTTPFKETNKSALAREHPPLASSYQKEGFALPSGTFFRLRRRLDMKDLVERMWKERQREIEAMEERRVVSRFSHRGRIQSVLKLRFLRRESTGQDRPPPSSRKRESVQSQSGSSILLLRKRFDKRSQNSGNQVKIIESSRNQDSMRFADRLLVANNYQYKQVVSPGDQESSQSEMKSTYSGTEGEMELSLPNSGAEGMSEDSELSSPNSRSDEMDELNSPHSTSENAPELDSLHSENEDTPGLCSPRSRTEDLLQAIQSPHASWDERSLWVSNLDWQGSAESSPSRGWQGEAAAEEIEPCIQQHVQEISHIWIGSSSPRSWRGLELDGQDYHDFVENFSDNMEIRKLLERRMVSTSLSSDFCSKMNRLILTFMNRKDQIHDDDYSEMYEEQQPMWKQNYEFKSADRVVSGSSPLPSSYQSAHCPHSCQYTSFTDDSVVNSRELESVHDLRTEMAQMHQEIRQLRKLVESCLEWQTKLQYYIKDEVSKSEKQPIK